MKDINDLTFEECWEIFEEMTPNMSEEEREDYMMDSWGE